MNDLIIAKLDAANRLLVEAKTIQQTKVVIDLAIAAEGFARHQKLGDEAIGHAHSIKVYALQKLGEMLRATERNQGARFAAVPKENRRTPTLAEIGIDKKISSLAQKVAALPQEKVDALAARVETINRAHVGENSGDNEWYTPIEIAEAARRVMGGIDLDPASCLEANAVIKAVNFFTQDNPITTEWCGKVFMNPPYAQPLCSEFIYKLIASDGVTQTVVLVNNATETSWGQALLRWCDAVAFPSGRVKFWHPRKVSAPLQGQMICYKGAELENFIKEFSEFGEVFSK